ncbi:MAG: hypothetical protein J3K34DRAFT_465129 [Monoraphidium minutum]|nr:MAG: hypothetical protein J3K34DRAFT_465129 [Monoraphidium minutum]
MPAPRVAALRPAHAADAPPPPPLPLLASHTEDGGEGEGEEEQGGTEDGAGAVLGERRQAEQDEEQEQEQEEGQQQRQSQQQKQQKQKEQQQQQHQEEKQQAQQAQQQQEEARQQRPHGREGTSRLAPRAGAPGAVFSPVFNAAASTQPRALAGALARASEAHRHVLVFAAGPAAVNAAVKALATARGFLRASSGGGLEVLVQPTLRGRAPGADALALDVFFAPAPLALPPGGSGPGNRLVRVTGGSFEAEWARNLVANMPRRGQTVMKVAGAYAVENAVKSVALARGPLGRALGQDLIFVPLWCDEAGFEPPLGPRSPRGRRDGAPKAAWAAAQPAFAAAAAEGRPGGAFQVRPKLRLAVMRCIQGSPLSLVATSKAMPADDAPP